MTKKIGGPGRALRTAQASWEHPDPLGTLRADLGDAPLAFLALFVTPRADFETCVRRASELFPGTEIVACTTAGEISSKGYVEGEIVAVALPRALFSVKTMLIADLDALDADQITMDLIRARAELTRQAGTMAHDFAFLTIDGLSLKEDQLMSALAPGLGSMQLFGGSAGDGLDFHKARVALDGVSYNNAAVLTLVRTHCPVRVFSLDHFTPTDRRMVVTRADTKNRLVQEINAEPAAREYARVLGKDPDQLDTFTFASHPVVVRFGGRHHVRAIQRVNRNGDLVFFSAIDEGLVLSLAEPEDMVTHLERELGGIAAAGRLDGILACDCILRRVEAEKDQASAAISRILRDNRVIGFATYGEQADAMHVNQTMTGVAIFEPEP